MKKGQKFNIEPSMGYCDICRGEVQIVRIADYDDVYEEYADPEVIVDCEPEARDRKWIVYKYTKPTNRDMQEKYCLDEETFKYHTSGKVKI